MHCYDVELEARIISIVLLNSACQNLCWDLSLMHKGKWYSARAQGNGKRETETKCRVENSILQLEECYPALAVVKPCETSKIRPPLPLGSMLKMLLSRSAQKK